MADDLAETREAFESAYGDSRKTVRETVGLYPGDLEMLAAVMDFLGCSKSEAVRTGIRILATQLPLKGKPRKKKLQFPT